MHEFLLLIMGIAGLWIGAESVVHGSAHIARFLRVSPLLIGLTVVSIGTSLPEIAVSIAGGLERLTGIETSGIVVGNALGSCLNQITIILGIVGLFGVLLITKRELVRDGLMLLGSIAFFFLVSWDGMITRLEGAIMIIIYLIYFINLFREERTKEKRREPTHILADVIALAAGLIIIIISSRLTVDNGVALAQAWGIRESLIGILIIGLGTGLPELAVSLSAVRHKAIGIAVGNLIGSNICDLLFSLGLGTVISGFIVGKNLLKFDIIYMFGAALFILILFRRKMRLKKREAMLLILVYIVYLGLKLKGF